MPFWPGGLEDPLVEPIEPHGVDGPSKKGLRTVPPGLSRGLRLPGEEFEDNELAALDDLQKSRQTEELVRANFLLLRGLYSGSFVGSRL